MIELVYTLPNVYTLHNAYLVKVKPFACTEGVNLEWPVTYAFFMRYK